MFSLPIIGAPNSAIYASKIVEGRKGEFMSLNFLVGGVARILGPTAGTFALHNFGHAGVFGLLAAAYGLGLLCFGCVFSRFSLPPTPGTQDSGSSGDGRDGRDGNGDGDGRE